MSQGIASSPKPRAAFEPRRRRGRLTRVVLFPVRAASRERQRRLAPVWPARPRKPERERAIRKSIAPAVVQARQVPDEPRSICSQREGVVQRGRCRWPGRAVQARKVGRVGLDGPGVAAGNQYVVACAPKALGPNFADRLTR